jgi:DNA-binding NarL/FixJ family response regulator
MTIRVMVCDEVGLIHAGLQAILSPMPDIEVVGAASDGSQAVPLVLQLRPDVLVTDIPLGSVSGIEVTRRLMAADLSWPLRVLIFTLLDDDECVFDALRAGATGFLVKGSQPDQLIEGIRVLAAGQAILAPSVTPRLLRQLVHRLPPPSSLTSPLLRTLTAREVQVLQLVAQGLSNLEIAKELSIGEATVKSHIYHLRLKLHLNDRSQLVAFAYQTGLAGSSSDLEPGLISSFG